MKVYVISLDVYGKANEEIAPYTIIGPVFDSVEKAQNYILEKRKQYQTKVDDDVSFVIKEFYEHIFLFNNHTEINDGSIEENLHYGENLYYELYNDKVDTQVYIRYIEEEIQ